MTTRVWAVAFALTLVARTLPAHARQMYGSTNNRVASARGAVGIVSQTDGTFTLLGDPTPSDHVLAGIDFNSHQQLFGVDNPSGSNNSSVLILIDAATGALQQTIGPVIDSATNNGVRISDLAFQPLSDVLFGIANDGRLFRINTTTAAAVLVGDTGLGSFSLGLAFAPNGTLYATSGASLYELDPTTGLPVQNIPTSGGTCLDGLAVRPTDGLLFATECDGNGVYSINTSTGDVTFVGPENSDDPDTADLAFAPLGRSVPALSRLGLMLVAILLLGSGVLLQRARGKDAAARERETLAPAVSSS